MQSIQAESYDTPNQDENILEPHTEIEAPKAKQPKITNLFFTKSKLSHRSEQITMHLTEMVVQDMLPISFVEGTGFNNFIKYLEPNYNVPSRNTIASRVNLLYETKKHEILNKLEEFDFIAITTDCWSSTNTDSYITVTAHGISESWEMYSFTLNTKYMSLRHTAENLQEELLEIATNWGIENKIVATVHDNAANITKAVNNAHFLGVNVACFAHTLQLALNKGLKSEEISEVIAKCSAVVSHFNHSNVATTALQNAQQQLNLPQHKLLQSVTTRWNSTYYMIERVLEQRQAILNVINDRSITSRNKAINLEILESNWTVIENLCIVLKPFEIATTYMCSQNIPCLSIVNPLIHSFLINFLNENDSNSSTIKIFKQTVKNELEKRFIMDANYDKDTNVLPNIADICRFLDPRYKNFDDNERQDSVKKYIKTIIEKEDSDKSDKQEAVDIPSAVDSLFPHLTSSTHSHISEIENFINEKEISRSTDPLQWWKMNKHRFPAIETLARKYLCIPATSAPSERVFSTAGNIITAKRNCLSRENVDKLVFLHQNYK